MSAPTHCMTCGAFLDKCTCGVWQRTMSKPPAVVETKETNPKDAAASNRVSLSLIPASARIAEALAFTEGARKYGAYNWRVAGVCAHVYIDAINRHLERWWNGEECDPITSVSHLGSARAGLGILIDAMACGKLNDDRPPKQDMTKQLDAALITNNNLARIIPNPKARYRETDSYEAVWCAHGTPPCETCIVREEECAAENTSHECDDDM